MPMTLGYWDIRGLAHAIRLLLEYTDSSYEEKRYTMGDAPDYDRSQWLSEKFKLGLDFPNLPYLIDGPHKITQSNAILRYLARKHNLCGETEEEKIRVDILENQAMDVSNQLARVCYSPDFEKMKAEYLEQLPGMMKLFSQFLGKQTWFVGEKITFVDFLAYDILDLHLIFEPTCLDAFPNLKDFVARFEGLKKISAYMKTSCFLRSPLYTRVATWGNKWETEEERIPVDILENQVMDTRMQLAAVCYSPDFEQKKLEYLEGLPEKIKLYSEFLGKRPWFAGAKITFVDFLAYDILDQHRVFANLKDFMARFEGLKKVSDYMKSSRFVSKPFFAKNAVWNP